MSFDDVYFQLAELRKQMNNLLLPATVKSFDAKTNTIVADIGTDTHAIPGSNHAGTAKAWHPMKVGQQVTLICPGGDIANATFLPGGFHDANPAPSDSADEDIIAERNGMRFRLTDTGAFIEAGAASISLVGGVITLKGTKIIADGQTLLGGADASNPAAMQGTLDTAGNADVANLATNVLVK